MVSTLTWVLAGIVLYTVLAMALRARNVLPSFVKVQGPITTIHTKRGRVLLDRLAAPKRFWRAWGNFGVGIALVVMFGSFFLVLTAGIQSARQPASQPVRNPQNVLVIPGVNEFLPLSAAPEIVFGLVVGLIVHEGGHGLLCRVENIDIDSMGLALFAFIPVGAFVEPSEESRNRANRGSQTRMFAAGVTNNFAITVVAFLLLFGPVMGSIAVADGVPVGDVADGSAAADAGVARGDVITSVEGQPVANASQLEAVLARTDERRVRVGREDAPALEVERTVMITRAIPGVLDGRTPEEGINISGETPRITAVNGTAVYTERDFVAAVGNRTVARITTTAGEATFPIGAYVTRVGADGPLAAAGAPTNGTQVIVTRIGGQRTVDIEALDRVLETYEPGETVTVEAYVADQRRTYEVTLGESPDGDGGFLGVFLQPGMSGLTVDDFGIDVYPADRFLSLLGGGEGTFGGLTEGSVLQQVIWVLILPFISVIVPGVAYNFAGFVPLVADFYAATGPLGFLGGGVFTLANVLFWTGWINLQLGLFNCIPAFPLDGGHILRTSTEAVISRLPVEGGRRLTSAVTISISLVMLAGLFLMIFGPQLLS